MEYINTFKRYEIKYILTTTQKEIILRALSPFMKLDQYKKTTIRNIYFDTDNFRLIRRSIEKPIYKEKLRLRSYSQVSADADIFVELKKKYNSVVYKRRLILTEQDVMYAFNTNTPLPINSQIGSEIEYFRQYYKNLKPQVFLFYDREAYYSIDETDLRITFDDNICYRTDKLSLCESPSGKSILDEGLVLMEIKTTTAIPLWLTNILTENKIYKTSFSKYGTAYMDILINTNKGDINYA